MIEQSLVGKKIMSAEIKGIDGCDDLPFLLLKMEDGSVFTIISYYDDYTGKSDNEYPRCIRVVEGELTFWNGTKRSPKKPEK